MASWGVKRQLFFLFAGIIFLVVAIGLGFLATKKTPSCFDNKQNQDELGVDCGGVCQSVCFEEARTIDERNILWVRPFMVSHGRYGAIALIENPNIFGARELKYRFKLYDKNNILVKEKEGITYVNPDEQFIIFETNIDTGNRDADSAFLEIESQSLWERFSTENARPIFSIQNKRPSLISPPAPNVSASLRNDSFVTTKNVEVTAIIFDTQKNAISASRTVVDILTPGESKDIFFTWPEDFVGIPSFVELYPRVNRFSITR